MFEIQAMGVALIAIILLVIYLLVKSQENFEIISEDKKTINNIDKTERTNFEKSKYYQYMTALEDVDYERKINKARMNQ